MSGQPNALPVANFLLYERAYPDSVAASVGPGGPGHRDRYFAGAASPGFLASTS